MAKIKFKMVVDGVGVRTVEELRENFFLEDVLLNYKNGTLTRWLDSLGSVDELAKVNGISSNDDYCIAKELVHIFGIEAEDSDIDDIIKSIKSDMKISAKNESVSTLGSVGSTQNVAPADEENKVNPEQKLNDLIEEIIENPDDEVIARRNITEIVTGNTQLFNEKNEEIFWKLADANDFLAILILLTHKEARNFYLPIVKMGRDGKYHSDIEKDMPYMQFFSTACGSAFAESLAGNKSKMYLFIRSFTGNEDILKSLKKSISICDSHTNGYWEEIEPKDGKYMIISVPEDGFVRPVKGNEDDLWIREEDDDDLDYKEGRGLFGKFEIFDGIQYCCEIDDDDEEFLYYLEV